MSKRALAVGVALASLSVAASARAQPSAPPAAVEQGQVRQRVEQEAAERAARAAAPNASEPGPAPPRLGPFPVETPCFTLREIQVSGARGRALAWIPGRLAQFKGRCAGPRGLDYILKSLERDLLARGLITTRAGLPQQDLSKGVLAVQMWSPAASPAWTAARAAPAAPGPSPRPCTRGTSPNCRP